MVLWAEAVRVVRAVVGAAVVVAGRVSPVKGVGAETIAARAAAVAVLPIEGASLWTDAGVVADAGAVARIAAWVVVGSAMPMSVPMPSPCERREAWIDTCTTAVMSVISRRIGARRASVQRPVDPRRAGETILEEDADDGHRREAAVRNRSSKLPLLILPLGRVRRSQHLEAGIARNRGSARRLDWRRVVGRVICHDLRPDGRRHHDGAKAAQDVRAPQGGRRGAVVR